MDPERPLVENVPNGTHPRQTTASKEDGLQGRWKDLVVHPPTPADGDPEISPPLLDVSSPRPSVEHPQKPNPQNYQPGQALLPHNQSPVTQSDLLFPPTVPPPRSDSARSYMSFESIKSIHDRGVGKRANWMSTHPRGPFRRPSILGEPPVTLKSLSCAICDRFQPSRGSEGEEFLPLDALDGLINPTTVKELFESENLFPGRVTKILQGIFGNQECQNPQQKPNLQRIFTILVLMKQVKTIQKFISNGINDSALPLSFQRGSNLWPLVLCNSEATDVDDAKLQDCFTEFEYNDRTLFLVFQRRIYVPFFQFPRKKLQVSFYDLEKDCILPFTEVGEVKEGGFGSVRQIRIHPAHHNIEKADISFAVKTLDRKSDDKVFRDEVEAYEKLAHKTKPSSSDHLMHLELVYRHGDECCLIFPWANGNLKEYWTSHQRSPGDRNDVLWFFKQCFGIALGLSRLHNPTSYDIANTPKDDQVYTEDTVEARYQQAAYGRHGDIKPENILWFENHRGDKDHLVISDFGLTQFKSYWSKSLVSKLPGFSGTHRPPDINPPEMVNRRYDIWSLGCVFLELVSWLLRGSDAPKAFAGKRMRHDPRIRVHYSDDTFFYFDASDKDSQRPMVKPYVLEWIQELHALDTCPNSVHDFLDIIQEKMLQPKAADRSESKMIRVDLRGIYERCKENGEYSTKGKPRKSPKEFSAPAQQEPPESEDRSQSDLFPKLTEEVQRRASQGRRGPEAKPDDADEEGAQDLELGFDEQSLSAEPMHTALQGLVDIINADTATCNNQPAAPEPDTTDSPPSDFQRSQRHSDSASPEFLPGADESHVDRVDTTTAFHDKGADKQQEESSVSRISVPEASPTSSTRNPEPQNGTAAPVLLPSRETVSHGTQTQPPKSWLRKIVRRLGCFRK